MSGGENNQQPHWSVTGESGYLRVAWYQDLSGGLVAITVGRLSIHLNRADAERLTLKLQAALKQGDEAP